MHDVILIGCREALFLALIACMGVGPAAFLPSSFPRTARVALAPILGLSLAVCLFTSVEWYINGNQAQWLVVPIALLSAAIGIWWDRKNRHAPTEMDNTESLPGRWSNTIRPTLQILIVCLAISLPAIAMLSSQHSAGPTAYEVYDSPGYVATADGAQVLSIGAADHASVQVPNLMIQHWLNQVQTNNRLDYTPVSAAINALSGLHGTETWAAYLLAVLVAGGLALYGCICVAAKRESWFAVIGAGLGGGAFFLQLFMDGSQAAIAGLGLIVPLLLLMRENVLRPSRATFVLTALLLGGLTTVYPIFFLPIIATTVIFYLIFAFFKAHRQWTTFRKQFVCGVTYIVGVFLLASLLDPLAAIRNIPGWATILSGGGGSASQPQYHLGFGAVSSWLFQVRDFYTTAFGPQSLFSDVIPTLLIPLALIVVVLIGIRRIRAVWIPLLFVGICVVSATKQVASDSCAYCEDRSLLPVVPVALFVIFTTLTVVLSKQSVRDRLFGCVGVAIYLAFAGFSLTNEQNLFTTNGIFLPDSVGRAVAALPPTNKPVELEGFSGSLFPSVLAEEALPYEELIESVGSGVSFFAEDPGHGITNSFGPANHLIGGAFHADYGFIITRVPQIDANRRIIESSDGVALEARAMPLDVTLERGLGSSTSPAASGAVAGVVNGSLDFVITGTAHSNERLELEFVLPSASLALPHNPSVHLRKSGVYVQACIAIHPQSARTQVSFNSFPIDAGIVLRAMSASYGICD